MPWSVGRPQTVAGCLAGVAGMAGLLLVVLAVAGRGQLQALSPPADLVGRGLRFPVPAVNAKAMSDSFAETRGVRVHHAVDILAPRGSPVVAVDDGKVARLSTSPAGGIAVYQFDTAERYSYYYAHLDRYAAGLSEGQSVRRGQVIAYVGTTGNAPRRTPHLHFAIYQVVVPKQWWGGRPVDPYPLLK